MIIKLVRTQCAELCKKCSEIFLEIYRFVTMVYSNTTITILEIIHRPVFYLKHYVSNSMESVSIFR
jgi:hypothetical protein